MCLVTDRRLRAPTWLIVHTWGNNRAYRRDLRSPFYVLLTDEDGRLPERADEPVLLGLYDRRQESDAYADSTLTFPTLDRALQWLDRQLMSRIDTWPQLFMTAKAAQDRTTMMPMTLGERMALFRWVFEQHRRFPGIAMDWLGNDDPQAPETREDIRTRSEEWTLGWISGRADGLR